MLWIQAWITNSIVLPLIRQARNRIRNIKIVNNADGTSTFTDSEGVSAPVTLNHGTAVFETGTWTSIVKFNQKAFSSTLRLSLISLHGSFVYAQKFDIAVTHPGYVDVVVVHSRLYGTVEIKVDTDSVGSGIVYMRPISGNNEAGKLVYIRVDDALVDSFEIGADLTLVGGVTNYQKTFSGNESLNEMLSPLKETSINGVNQMTPNSDVLQYNGSGAKYGFFVVKYPFEGASFTMNSITFQVYNYQDNGVEIFTLGGYNYSSPRWYNTSAKAETSVFSYRNKVRFVRFLKEGGDEAVEADYTQFGFIFGNQNETSSWSYPKWSIRSIFAGHQNTQSRRWLKPWSIEHVAPEDIGSITPYKVDIERIIG